MYVVLGALAVFVALIALAWFVVLRRMDEGNFEAGRRLHPPWIPRKALPVGGDLADERADRAWSESRQLAREDHAGARKGMEDAKDRNVGRSWGG
jgi:hypothetical protein